MDQTDPWQLAVANRSRIGIYTLFLPVDFNCVCCGQSRWLPRGNRCILEQVTDNIQKQKEVSATQA